MKSVKPTGDPVLDAILITTAGIAGIVASIGFAAVVSSLHPASVIHGSRVDGILITAEMLIFLICYIALVAKSFTSK